MLSTRILFAAVIVLGPCLAPLTILAGEAVPSDAVFLDFSATANMGFRDEVERDGRGGWSDQGDENDFRDFDVNAKAFGGVPFRVLDPATNGGRAVMTFSSPHVTVNLKQASVSVANQTPVRYLYLLHTTCWNNNAADTPIGTLRAEWDDGTETRQDVLTGREAGDWWNPTRWSNGAVVASKNNPQAKVGVYLSRFELAPAPRKVKRVTFETAGNSIWIIVAGTLSATDYPLPQVESARIEEGDMWREADARSPVVEPDSILDLSWLVEPGPAGKHGPVIARKDGHLAFRDRPDQPLRFFCNSIIPFVVLGRSMDKEAIARFAEQTRRQGYNMVRPHFLDHPLTESSERDLEFNPDVLDRFDYLVHCLKQNGIYLYVDAMTSWRGYKKGYPWDKAAQEHRFKERILTDDEVREHWREGVTKLMTHKNPYTGTTLATDPMVVAVLGFNEQNLNIWRKDLKLPPSTMQRWREWLKEKYRTPQALAQAWTRNGKSILPSGTDFDAIPDFTYEHIMGIYTGSPRGRDLALFLADLHGDLYAWYVQCLREMGYQGLVTQYDWLPSLHDQTLRAPVPLISMHGYHAHPSNYIIKDSRISQESSLGQAGNYFCSQAMTRYGGRPFFIMEYGQVFWNRYRYEEGPFFGAYAALQNFDCLTAHSAPVVTKWSPIKSFNVGDDPVARASQVVSAFAFMRRDVSTSPHYVDVRIDPEAARNDNKYYSGLSADQSRLALLTGAGISIDDKTSVTPPPTADLRLPVFGVSSVRVEEYFAEVLESPNNRVAWQQTVQQLRKQGILPAHNRTDVDGGIYESDTGELLLESETHRLQVVTPRLESVCLDPSRNPAPVQFPVMRSAKSDVQAAISVIAIDGTSLANAKRVLLVYATDALNSGMTFSAPDRVRLQELGGLPVLIRTGRLDVKLKVRRSSHWRAWAVGLDGKRSQELAVKYDKDIVVLDIDTGALTAGATPFFELSSDE